MAKKKENHMVELQKKAAKFKKKFDVSHRVGMKLAGIESKGKDITKAIVAKLIKEEQATKAKKDKARSFVEDMAKQGYKVEGTYTEYLLEKLLKKLK